MTAIAYSEIFLSDAMDTLGEAIEYAVCMCGVDGQEFLNRFIASGVAEHFQEGEPRYLSGMSGIELVRLVMERSGGSIPADRKISPGYTPEYWTGWVYAYYQWLSGYAFAEIFHAVPFVRLLQMYRPLHEADISKAAAILDEMMEHDRGNAAEELLPSGELKLRVHINWYDGEGYIAHCEEIEDLIALGATREAAVIEMCNCLLEYAEDYYNDFELYSKAPNRKHHLPYVERIRVLAAPEQVKEMLVCMDETAVGRHAQETGEQEKTSSRHCGICRKP